MNNLLFDFGNVIIDIDVDGAMDRLGRLLKKDADKAVIDKVLIDYECGRVSTDIFINTIISQSLISTQAFNVIEAWNSMLVGIPSYRLEMLRALRNKYNVYMLSNTNELHLQWIHQYLKRVYDIHHFEKEFFDQVFYSHLIGDRKPLPSVYRHVIDETLLTPELTLYMDDVKENIEVAKKLGFGTHLVKEGEEIAEYLKVQGYY